MIIKLIEHNPKLSIAVIAIIMLAFNMDVLEVTIMEARNFITAREMLTDGNWLLTTMNGEPRYQKPPLPTWLAAISAFFFGIISVFAMRLPGFLMVIALAKYNYLLSNQLLKNKQHSLINGLLTLTSFYVIGIVIEAPWDIFTHGFMLIGIYHLFQLFGKDKGYWKHTLMAGVCIGLSIMSKGPISFYALLLPFLIAYGLVYKYKHFKAKWFSVFSLLLLALVIGGWWYLYVRYADPETFLEITKKETGNWSSYNVRPFYYYWSFFTQSGLWTIPAFVSLLYPYLKTRVSHLKAYKFTLLWTLLAVVLLSIIPEKKSRYLMPVLIPLALNVGFYIEYLFRRFKNLTDKRETVPVYFNFGLISLIGLAFPVAGYLLLKDTLTSGWLQFSLAAIVLFALGVLLLKALIKKQIKFVFYLCIGFMVAVFLFVVPLSIYLKQDNYNPISSLKVELDKASEDLFSLGDPSPEIIWNYGGKIKPFDINNLENQNEPLNIIVQTAQKEDLEKLEQNYTIEFITTYSLNTVSEGTRGYKDRLSYNYYRLTQK
ncbi:MAG: phospholipid carrier-dependent glycosyltransferase [Flavobacteriaceae bacterium]